MTTPGSGVAVWSLLHFGDGRQVDAKSRHRMRADLHQLARNGDQDGHEHPWRDHAAPATAQSLMEWKVPTLARVANGWSMNTDTMGVYGNYYLKRAIIAQIGLGANLAEDAIYPFNL